MQSYTPLSYPNSNRIFRWLSLVFLGIFLPMTVQAAVMPDFTHLSPLADSINKPVAVALDSAGRVYVAEPDTNQVVVLSQSGRYISRLTGLSEPISVAVDTGGRIYVGSKMKGNVAVYDAGFTLLFKLGSGDGEFIQPNDICIDAAGKIYVADTGSDIVRIYDFSGRPAGSIGGPGNADGQFHHPVSIAIDETAGEIIVLDRQLVEATGKEGARIQFVTMNGSYLGSFTRNDYETGGMFRPQDIAIDSAGRIYVTDSFQNVVLVYDRSGTTLGAVADADDPLRVPLGIAFSPANRLYIASRMGKRIDAFGIDDYASMAVSPPDLKFTTKEGEMAPPPLSLTVQNNGTAPFSWTAVTDAAWLDLSIGSGMLAPGQEAELGVTVDITGLAAGKYTGNISVRAGPGLTEVVRVVLNVEASAILFVTSADLSFAGETGTAPASGAVTIANRGSASMFWTIWADQPWIKLSATSGRLANSGAEPETVTVTADVLGLAAGTYTGMIMVRGYNAVASPVAIGVSLTLSDPADTPGQTPPPGTEWSGNFSRKWTVVSQLDGTSLNSIWGSSCTDIFAVGDMGTILHYDGRDWLEEDAGVALNLNGVWGVSAVNVYAVGDFGLILHYDGDHWSDASPTFSGMLQNVWCGSDSNCLAVGQDDAILPNSGINWSVAYTVEYSGSLRGVWGSSETDMYAVGDLGTILHNDGTGWSHIDSGTAENLYDVWGSAADNIFAVGRNGTILHFNGTTWAPMQSGTTVTLRGIWGNAANEVYAVGEDGTMLLYQGMQWNKLATGISEDLNDTWGGRVKEIYAVGADGSIIFGTKFFPWSLLQPVLLQNERKKVLQDE